MVRYRCTRCGGLIETDESQRGKLHACPHCHVASEVPVKAAGVVRDYRAVNVLIIAGAVMSAVSLASVVMHASSAPAAESAKAPIAQAKPAAEAKPAPQSAQLAPATVVETKPAPQSAQLAPAALVETKPAPPAPTPAKPAPKPAAVTVVPENKTPMPAVGVVAPKQGIIMASDFSTETVAMGTAPKVSPLNRPWIARRPDLEVDYTGGIVTTRLGRLVGMMLSIKRAPTFAPPARMHLSATVKSGTAGTTAEDFRGAGLGFYSTDPQSNSSRIGFYGLILTPDGRTALWLGQKGADASEMVPYPGTYDAKAWHKIDFDVDTSARKLSNAQIDGKPIQIKASTTDFNEANLAYVGIMLSAPQRASECPSAKDIMLTALK